MAGERRRVLVIGLDGATFNLIDPWTKQGALPNMGSLLREGVRGELRSIIQPTSPGAWSSFATGKNPGKHGVFDWRIRRPESYELIPVTGRDRQGQSLWDILSEENRKVGIINMPLTYPPGLVNGYIVSGIDTPSTEQTFTYPPGLTKEILEKCGGYIIDASFQLLFEGRYEEWFGEIERMIEIRRKALEYLLEKSGDRWDFLTAVFIFPDRLYHVLWHALDPSHPHYTPAAAEKYAPVVLRFHEKIDELLGEIIAHLDERSLLLVVSDHGFGPTHRAIYLNKFLEELGLLKFREGGRPARIDWPHTKAYAFGYHGNIYLNLKGREPEGQVNPGGEYEDLRAAIIRELEQFRDPESGQRVVTDIYKREDIYCGSYVEMAPDILFQTHRMEYRIFDGFSYIDDPSVPLVGPPPPHQEGAHRMDGILIAWGPHVKSQRLRNSVSIMDLAPTILYWMGVPIPDDMDGRVLPELFDEQFISQTPLLHREAGHLSELPSESVYSDEDIARITKRLKGLGYIP